MSNGWNPANGRDASQNGAGRPPFGPVGAPMLGPGQPQIPPSAGPGYYNWTYGNYNNPWYGNWNNMAYGMNSGWPQQHYCQGDTANYYPYANQPNGAGNYCARGPHPWPNVDENMPAAQLTNSSGGTGCEPGYNYFFAAEHTKIHVFHTSTPPWQLPHGTQIQFKATHLPCSTGLPELLRGFGCDNPNPKKNKCYEITPGGNGTWYKGLSFNGGDKEMMKKTVAEIGWDASRTGHVGEKPVVCLWFAKN